MLQHALIIPKKRKNDLNSLLMEVTKPIFIFIQTKNKRKSFAAGYFTSLPGITPVRNVTKVVSSYIFWRNCG